jgi:hypothetical protein
VKFIEAIIFGLLFLFTLSVFIPTLQKISRSLFFSFSLLFALVIHFMFEGYRWQMTIAYLLSLIFILPTLARSLKKSKSVQKSRSLEKLFSAKIIGVLWTLLLLSSLSLPILFPAFELPRPTGPFSVGTTYFFITDVERKEVFTSDPDDLRKIFVRTWYPAKVDKVDEPVPYMQIDEYKAVAVFESMPSFLYSDFPSIKTHSHLNADLPDSDEIFPVLLFSHGAGGNIITHTSLMEELASHGYVVFNIAHPHLTAFTKDEKGQIISYDRKHVDKIICEAEARKNEIIKDKILSTNDYMWREELYKELISLCPKTLAAVDARSLDMITIINNLNDSNFSINNFAARLDTSKIGVLGFSLGGATAEQACISDPRIKAGINIDGIMVGNFMKKNISVPFMFITSEQMAIKLDDRIRDQFHEIFYNKTESIAYMLAIENTTHANLTDWSLFGGLLKFSGVLGGIDGYQCTEILRLYIRSFFDKHLKNEEVLVLNGQFSDYPEVQLRARKFSTITKRKL